MGCKETEWKIQRFNSNRPSSRAPLAYLFYGKRGTRRHTGSSYRGGAMAPPDPPPRAHGQGPIWI
eukprot:1312416-Karenia_brevis.AAC.1